MKYTIILLLLIVVAFSSCKRKQELKNELLTIQLKESKDFLPLSSFMTGLSYLELELSEVDLEIGEIRAIKEIGDDLIIKQRKAGEISFIRFTNDGKFIAEIVNNRKDAVVNPLDIIEYKGDYAVLGENGIHIFSKNGKYKSKFCSGEMAGRKFIGYRDQFYVINEGPADVFLSEISKNNSATQHVNVLDERLQKLNYTNVTANGTSKSLISSFNNTIFEFENGKLVPLYQLKGEGYPTLSEVWSNIGDRSPRETMRYIFDTQNILVRNYLENNERVFMTYWVGSLSTTVIINKENWEPMYYGRGVNDIDGGIWDTPMYLSQKNELYVPLSAYQIGGHKISNKRNKDFEHLQLHIAASGNPVIMKCTLE